MRFTKTIRDITNEFADTLKSITDDLEFLAEKRKSISDEEIAQKKDNLCDNIEGLRYLISIIEAAHGHLPNVKELDRRFKEMTGL